MTYNYGNSGNDIAICWVGNVPEHGMSLHMLYAQGGQRTSYIRKLYNGGNCSTIWQNKTHFYTILTTNLYDKSQTKVPYGLEWYYLHRVLKKF
jgi:hypothetical protein